MFTERYFLNFNNVENGRMCKWWFLFVIFDRNVDAESGFVFSLWNLKHYQVEGENIILLNTDLMWYRCRLNLSSNSICPFTGNFQMDRYEMIYYVGGHEHIAPCVYCVNLCVRACAHFACSILSNCEIITTIGRIIMNGISAIGCCICFSEYCHFRSASCFITI